MLARLIFPPPVRRVTRRVLEDLRDWHGAVSFGLRFARAPRNRPKALIYFGFALGDDLLCTAVLRELRERGRRRVMMVSDHPELFVGNSDLIAVQPLWKRYSPDHSTVTICKRFVRIWGGQFKRLEYAPPKGRDRRRPPSRHIIAELCARVGITGPVSVRPYFFLSDEEKLATSWAHDRIVIQTSGMAARHPMRNKEWYPERFQDVVDTLQGQFEFIQLGSKGDPLLRNVKDMRGASSVRESAAILHQARLFVGIEGFLMHLARAVECPAVIVFGGRSTPWQGGYICNVNLYSEVPCAPCWRANTCEIDRQCMRDISAEDVVAAIRKLSGKPRNPLAVETVEVILDGATTSLDSSYPEQATSQ